MILCKDCKHIGKPTYINEQNSLFAGSVYRYKVCGECFSEEVEEITRAIKLGDEVFYDKEDFELYLEEHGLIFANVEDTVETYGSIKL